MDRTVRKPYTYVWTPTSRGREHHVESSNHKFVADCGSERMARKIAKLLNEDINKPVEYRA